MDERPGIAWQTNALWKKTLGVKDYLVTGSIRLRIKVPLAKPIIERPVL